MNGKGDVISQRQQNIVAILEGIFSLLILSSSAIPFAESDNINPTVFAIEDKPYGMTYGEWTAKWWQWIVSIPEMNHPSLDLTGEKCAIGQEGPVWFLTNTFGGKAERTCTIPAGKAILIPIINGECDYLTTENAKTEADLLRCASEGNENGIMEFTIDGIRLKNLENYRVQSPVFNITIIEDNAFGASSGPTRAIADGFWVFLNPLSVGQHDIHFKGSVVDPSDVLGFKSYSTDVIYHLIVKP